MRFLYSVIALIVLASCFWAGYQLGRNELVEIKPPTPPVVESEPPAKGPLEPAPEKATSGTPALALQEPVEPKLDEQARYEMEARAARGIVDLTNQQGRTIRVKILEAQADAIKVRRQVDFFVVEIPWKMLSRDDRRFAEFLWKRRQAEASESPATADSATPNLDIDEEISAELFDEIFGE